MPVSNESDAAVALQRLLEIMRRLRDPESGCPWDVAQDFRSIAAFTLEEAYEVVDAIERGSPAQICDELGDLLFSCVNLARHLKVDPETALRAATARFEARVGYVERALGDKPTLDSAELDRLWEAAKRAGL